MQFYKAGCLKYIEKNQQNTAREFWEGEEKPKNHWMYRNGSSIRKLGENKTGEKETMTEYLSKSKISIK